MTGIGLASPTSTKNFFNAAFDRAPAKYPLAMTMAKSAPASAASLQSWMVNLVEPVPLRIARQILSSPYVSLTDSRSSHNGDMRQTRLVQSLPGSLDQRDSLFIREVVRFTHRATNDGPDVGLSEANDVAGEGGDVYVLPGKHAVNLSLTK